MDSKWHSAFCSCLYPIDTCCLGCFCAPCLYGRIMTREENPTLSDFSYCNTPCVLWLVAAHCGLAGVLQFFHRNDLRKKYGIQGSMFGDFCASCCCGCFALIQEEKEIVFRQKEEVAVDQGYKMQEDMQFPPPVHGKDY